MLIRFLMLFILFAATGGRGKASGGSSKGKGSSKSAGRQSSSRRRRGGGKVGAFEVLQADLPAVAAAAGTTVPAELGEIPQNESQQNWGVSRLAITAPTLVTGNSANSGTINIRQMRAGSAVGTIGTLALVAGINLPAETPVAIPVSGSPVLLAGDVLDVQYVQIGTGLGLPAGTNVKAEIN